MFLKGLLSDDLNLRQRKCNEQQPQENSDVKKEVCYECKLEKNKQKDVIIINLNYTKNLGNNEAKYLNSEIECEKINYDKPIHDPEFLLPIFSSSQINSSNSMNSGIAKLEILDIEQCRTSMEEQLILQEQFQQQQTIQQNSNEEANYNKNISNDQVAEKEQYPIQPGEFQVLNIQEATQLQSPYSQLIINLHLPQYLTEFLVNPLSQSGMIQCIVVRDNSGLNLFTPKFKMYLSQNKSFLASARKKLNKHKYIITEDNNGKQYDESTTIGRIEQSKQSSADYCLYGDEYDKTSQPRKQLGGVFYSQSNVAKQPRNMTVLVKSPDNEQCITTFENRKPVLKKQFNQTIYTLDFFGRVKQPSVKNVQLVMRNNGDLIYLQFGKVNKEQYNLDFMSPLSPLLAFEIALTIFDFNKK